MSEQEKFMQCVRNVMGELGREEYYVSLLHDEWDSIDIDIKPSDELYIKISKWGYDANDNFRCLKRENITTTAYPKYANVIANSLMHSINAKIYDLNTHLSKLNEYQEEAERE